MSTRTVAKKDGTDEATEIREKVTYALLLPNGKRTAEYTADGEDHSEALRYVTNSLRSHRQSAERLGIAEAFSAEITRQRITTEITTHDWQVMGGEELLASLGAGEE